MAVTAGKQLVSLAAAVHQRMMNTRCHQLFSLLQVRNYAARKGTREKARKKKVKAEVIKPTTFVPYNKFKNLPPLAASVVQMDHSWKPAPVDDVWLGKYHKTKIYSFAEAVECHRETHHPTCYDAPDAFLNAFVELNLMGDKKTKVIGEFQRTASVPHIFDHGEDRTVMAFAKNPELLALADEAGATISGGAELISKIQTGAISMDDYTVVVAHPEIMAEVSIVRGLMKKKFPNPRLGTMGLDLSSMIKKIRYGIRYKAIPHPRQPLCGTIIAPIGRLLMDVKQLEENFTALVKDVETIRPKREGSFIVRTQLTSSPSPESFIVDFQRYLAAEVSEDADYDSDDEEIERSNVI